MRELWIYRTVTAFVLGCLSSAAPQGDRVVEGGSLRLVDGKGHAYFTIERASQGVEMELSSSDGGPKLLLFCGSRAANVRIRDSSATVAMGVDRDRRMANVFLGTPRNVKAKSGRGAHINMTTDAQSWTIERADEVETSTEVGKGGKSD